jgi:murein L,D-transpeptidase YcbB/YkuD
MPVRVTYLTCAIGEWGLIRYEDIYELDQQLTNAFYQVPEAIAGRSNGKYRK